MMNKRINQWFGLLFVVVAIFNIAGCSLFEHAPDRLPTNPGMQAEMGISGNFIAGNGVSSEFQVFLTGTGFKINIPAPGDYLTTYIMPGIGTYNLVIRAFAPSLIAIGAPGQLESVFIQRGMLRGNPAPVAQSGAAQLFNWPIYPWEHLFAASGAKIALPLSGAAPQALPPRTGTIVIAAIGDSITYGKGSTQGGYVPMLEQKLRAAGYDVIVRKEAVPGERAAFTDARFYTAITGADIALIMIGTNDIVNKYACPAPGFCNASYHVGAMVNKAIQSGVRPFVSMIPPIRTSCEGFWSNYGVRQLNAQYVAVSRSRYVPLVDNYYPILRSGGDALFVDCLHFNDWGYNVIADQFFHALIAHNALHK